jgi:hypothetical protein
VNGRQHEDGLGLSLKLNLLPIAGQDVVIRRVVDRIGGPMTARNLGWFCLRSSSPLPGPAGTNCRK